MAETRQHHQFDCIIDNSVGYSIALCKCGWESAPAPSDDEAIDAWGDHLWFMDQQNLPDVLAD